ncbi:membrane-bound lytic murein transglycosylase MltC [Motilimonas pumila]|uniref:Membrane-bound lytic murein transglycosylase MltC n=1 Tax=Motilimonas pumila TaxID=2303987 RepID=A0A418YAX6_9GAMM|nr:membrane-bound lytic murein transglycosylase MltC [Motilimonas pumila]RJG40121.1 membrane-bound lytic murein transglycosylase MltC [Motilimonas pumila]
MSCVLLAACSSQSEIQSSQIQTRADLDKYLATRAQYHIQHPADITKDTEAFESLIGHFSRQVYQIWGQKDGKFASSKHYVKYTDNYLSRAEIDFERGMVTVETISALAPKKHLQEAIVTTLLTPEDPSSVDLFSDRAFILGGGDPFLYGQVRDQDGKPIQWQWRANRYADYLLNQKLTTTHYNGKKVWSVQFPLEQDHQAQREYKYAQLVKKYSRKYNIDESLIYAVMKTESSFNPYAVSRANAYGLMQVVPATAGRDVFEKVKKRSGQPSREYLFNPENNIDTGTAYLHILKTRYLKDIKDPDSLRYAIISAYNGGAGNVFKTFHRDRKQAPNVINQQSSGQVYQSLTKQHPSQESRRYLYKVNKAQKAFYTGSI